MVCWTFALVRPSCTNRCIRLVRDGCWCRVFVVVVGGDIEEMLVLEIVVVVGIGIGDDCVVVGLDSIGTMW